VKRVCAGWLWLLLGLLAVPAMADAYRPGFGAAPPGTPRELAFGIAPFNNPRRLYAIYGPLVARLNTHLRDTGVILVFEASRNHADFVRKLDAGHFAFALPNPYQTLHAIAHGYRVFGKMGADDTFTGSIVVRRDSAIREVPQLRGRAVAFPSPIALAATLMPQAFMARHGLDPLGGIKARYVGSMESSLMNLHLGNVDAACVWTPQWHAFAENHPKIAGTLRVQWVTRPLIDNGLVVREDVPEALVARVARALFGLQDSAAGRALLARIPLNRFEPADDATYAVVRRFLADYQREVGPLPLHEEDAGEPEEDEKAQAVGAGGQ